MKHKLLIQLIYTPLFMYNAHWYCEDMYWTPPELQNSQSEWKLKIQFLNVFVKVKVQTFLLWKIWNVCVGNVDGEMAPSGLTGKSAFAFCDSRWEASEKFRRQIIVFFSTNVCLPREMPVYVSFVSFWIPKLFFQNMEKHHLTITCEVAWWAVIWKVRPTIDRENNWVPSFHRFPWAFQSYICFSFSSFECCW